jgi:hypothetical protein
LLWLVAIEEVLGGFKPAGVNCLLWLAVVPLKRYSEVLNLREKIVFFAASILVTPNREGETTSCCVLR